MLCRWALIYNTGRMSVLRKVIAVAAAIAALAACASQGPKPLIDPFPMRPPLVVAGELPVDGRIAGQPWARDGIVYYRTTDGRLTAVVASSRIVLSRSVANPSETERLVRAGDLVFRRDGDTLRAVDGQGLTVWEFKARGALAADPVVFGGRVLIGDAGRMFYCLGARKGKVKWRRRLQGIPLHPAVAGGGAVAVAASNSVVYRLSLRGGSILSWEAVPSRVIHPLASAGSSVLVSSDSPAVTVLNLKTGKKAEPLDAPGPLVAGAVVCPPYVALFVTDEASGGQKIVFLRSR
jgi:outer membrane protein assembly factor BamB